MHLIDNEPFGPYFSSYSELEEFAAFLSLQLAAERGLNFFQLFQALKGIPPSDWKKLEQTGDTAPITEVVFRTVGRYDDSTSTEQ